MKRFISFILCFAVLLSCTFVGAEEKYAYEWDNTVGIKYDSGAQKITVMREGLPDKELAVGVDWYWWG